MVLVQHACVQHATRKPLLHAPFWGRVRTGSGGDVGGEGGKGQVSERAPAQLERGGRGDRKREGHGRGRDMKEGGT